LTFKQNRFGKKVFLGCLFL